MLAMGWEGYHLKEIRHGNYTYFVRLAGGQDPEPVEGFPQRDSFKYTLGDLLKEEWDSFIFVYDLGDALLIHECMMRSGEEVFLDDYTLKDVASTLQVNIDIVKSNVGFFDTVLDIYNRY